MGRDAPPAAILAVPLVAIAALGVAAQEGRFEERVDVSRVLIDLRVVDRKGDPLPQLEAGDFRVLVDGTPVSLESVRWISGTTAYVEGRPPGQAAIAGAPVAPPGRLLVFLLQKDIGVSWRINGLMRMKGEALKLLDGLEPEDRVAVFSFDTRLKLWLDFTNDHDRLRKVIDHSVLLENEPREHQPGSPVSLIPHYDRHAARLAASPEAGLLVIARALGPLPGAKSLAFLGWGMGRLEGGVVRMAAQYDEARRALTAARVVVFSLDVAEADYHSLEVGLQQVAEDTGGFYTRTHLFPSLAISKLESALAGYYTIAFEKPLLPPGKHRVKVELVGRKGTVLTTGSYVD
jgi:VWFA-related protein